MSGKQKKDKAGAAAACFRTKANRFEGGGKGGSLWTSGLRQADQNGGLG